MSIPLLLTYFSWTSNGAFKEKDFVKHLENERSMCAKKKYVRLKSGIRVKLCFNSRACASNFTIVIFVFPFSPSQKTIKY